MKEMAFRIANNVEALNVLGWLNRAKNGLDKSLERLSSGYRINHAADDSAGLAISNQFRHEIAALKIASSNTSQAINMVQTAEGSVNEVADMVRRLRELATEAASDTVDNDRRTYLNNEASAILNQIDDLATRTTYAGQALFTTGNFIIQVGIGTGSENRITMSFGALSSSSLGINAIDLTTQANAQNALTSISSALTSVNNMLNTIGQAQNKLEYALTQATTMIENFTASESTIRDVDMAAEMANFTKNQILVQTSMAMLAQANALPQNIVQLLR